MSCRQPAKKFDYYLKWTHRILEEFYSQGDKERELKMPVTPMLDRTKPIPLPKFQVRAVSLGHDFPLLPP